ncbi:hypothetical protein DFH09DRAFT_1162911 [Mycena vulgaris]|nr:hypothetical protein DFH09DRAFT_1162911 [Mycena vulgaris]
MRLLSFVSELLLFWPRIISLWSNVINPNWAVYQSQTPLLAIPERSKSAVKINSSNVSLVLWTPAGGSRAVEVWKISGEPS